MNEDLQHQGLLPYIEQERARILDACSQCGKCLEVCPMVPFLGLKTSDSKEVVRNVLSVVSRERPATDSDAAADALKWVMGCTASGVCVPACPESVNPKMMLRIARITALGGLGDEKLASKPEDPNWFPRIRAFARTQLTEDEQEDWM